MFDLEDASTDGTIDAQEFTIVCSSYGLDPKECEEAFGKMSKVCVSKAYSMSILNFIVYISIFFLLYIKHRALSK